MMRCPACKRRIENENLCPRCGMELQHTRELLLKAGNYYRLGKNALTRKDFNKALQNFKIADNIKHSYECKTGIVASLLGMGKYGEALGYALKNKLLGNISQ